MLNGGRFDFDDGGTYCGGWEDGKAHGHGVCTGPKGQGEYSGAWHYGFEVSGVYTWPSGNSYEGQWQNGKRHGLGVERRGRWAYRGEWTQGYKGRYGVRHSTNSQAKYEGTWANGLQDGYGVETYADAGTYQGQWLRGMRHGYGIRKSAPYGVAAKYRSRSHAHASLTSLRSDQSEEGNEKDPKKIDDSRGGFVLRARSEPPSRRRSLSERSVAVKRTILQGLRIKKQRSTGDIDQRVNSGGTGSLRSSGSTASCASDESAATGFTSHDHGSFIGVEEFVDPNAVETYVGEWKNDKRSGFGVSERSDGLKYEGEWFNNKKYGYGVTTFKDGAKEEGKYKNNVLVTSQRKKNLLFVRTSKLRERIDNAVASAQRATQIALQKADIAISRSGTAHERADQADIQAFQAREDAEIARIFAAKLSPDFNQGGGGFDSIKKPRLDLVNHVGLPSSKYSNLNEYSTPRSYVVGQPDAATMMQQQQHFIPKGSQPQQAGDQVLLMSNSVSPESTPPMLTPPQDVPSSKLLQSQQQPPSLITAGGYDPQQQQQRVLTTAQQQQQQLMQHQQPPTYNQTRMDSTFPMQIMPPTLQQQQLQQQQFRQQTQNVRQVSADSSYPTHPRPSMLVTGPDGAGGVDYVHANAVGDTARTAATRTVSQQPLQQQQHHAHAPITAQSMPFAGDMNVDYVDADADIYRSNIGDRRHVGAGGRFGVGTGAGASNLNRSPSLSSSHDSVNQMMNDFYEQYRLAPSAVTAKLLLEQQNYARRQQQQQQHGDTGSPLVSPGGSTLVRRSTLASARDWKKLTFENGGGSGGTESARPPQPQPSTSGHYQSISGAAAASSRDSSSSGGGVGTLMQKRHKPPILKQPSQHRYEGDGASGARGSVPDLTELVRTPVQMTREEIARLSSQRRQERARENEDMELLRNNPLRYLRYLFHPTVKAWIVRWKLPLLVLLVNICLSVIFCQLLTYSNLDKEDLNEND